MNYIGAFIGSLIATIFGTFLPLFTKIFLGEKLVNVVWSFVFGLPLFLMDVCFDIRYSRLAALVGGMLWPLLVFGATFWILAVAFQKGVTIIPAVSVFIFSLAIVLPQSFIDGTLLKYLPNYYSLISWIY